MSVLQDLPQVVTAIGGLGTAAFGLVDATKVFGGGVNHIGFRGIRTAVRELTDAGGPGERAIAEENRRDARSELDERRPIWAARRPLQSR